MLFVRRTQPVSRTPGAESGTGAPAAFRLPRESAPQAGPSNRAQERRGRGEGSPRAGARPGGSPPRPPQLRRDGPGHGADGVPPRDKDRAGTAAPGSAWRGGVRRGWGPRRGPRGAAGRGRRCQPRRPSPPPAALPGNLLMKIAPAPPPPVRPLPPRPCGGRSARPSVAPPRRPGRQRSGGPPSRHRIKKPETPGVSPRSPQPSLGTPEAPPPAHRQPPPSPPSPATPPRDRARPAPAADASPRTRPRDSRRAGPAHGPARGPERTVQSRARAETGPAHWSAPSPPPHSRARPRALGRLGIAERSLRPPSHLGPPPPPEWGRRAPLRRQTLDGPRPLCARRAVIS
ncbi:basic salivary proline-rich protein 1-like [Meriones unguiculatus]|uniref:basic salivary proline-rich protein 1-like n=1 Tax=Meriones unguiculatus TaxID=10047 RepID=UPI00293F6E06|nr:basic salivary proline-rich protein 1-like [Meriones unguiculatus]XP_060243730.1 basic salivary proline-rich protein 1-like [Meriones unguiculatus]XP_060243731.1 basic salivary proline-rich protein 1-like [Meriones unguiculatus]